MEAVKASTEAAVLVKRPPQSFSIRLVRISHVLAILTSIIFFLQCLDPQTKPLSRINPVASAWSYTSSSSKVAKLSW